MPSTPLFNPRTFFARRTPSPTGAALILYATGVVAVASAAPFISQPRSAEFSTGMLRFSILAGGRGWCLGIRTVSTVLVYGLSLVARGSGSVTRTAANIGWAYLPLLFVNTISTATVWILHFVGALPTLTPTQPQLPLRLVLFNTTTGILGYLWIGYLLAYAIHDARNLAIRRVALIAGFAIVIPSLCSISRLV